MRSLFILVLIATLFSGCREKEQSISPEAKTYLNEVITLLETKSVNRKHIDWTKFRTDVLAHAGKAVTLQEAHASVTYALQLLKDRHSSFNTPQSENSDNEIIPEIPSGTIPKDIGYLYLGNCPKDEDEIEMYRQQVIQQITEQDKRPTKGWIIDLRGNNNGSISPMLAAIAPILGNGTIGYFINDTNEEPWISENGKIYYGNTLVEDLHEFYKLKNNGPPVAVLTDGTTRNSGEAVAVAFKGRSKTQSFGAKTYGASVLNETYILSDGATISITTGYFADRNKTPYKNGIVPDTEASSDQVVSKAIEWLKKQ
ncbi:S41 family peptidase [Flavobacterium sp.]|uniref:S41 family peptidase n=1 Tax=Flavobacterium sp. TaxID=239 RepID=UPI00260C7653|nr:S41 family peptidase [Flavobacterium sp.]